MSLDGYRLRIPRLDGLSVDEKMGKARFYITIHEGRNRQVRRMCAIAQMTVIRLVRVQEGAIKLGNLPRGTWRYLSEEEIASIRE
jgi:23S rRNA pseudouridine2605 synthase